MWVYAPRLAPIWSRCICCRFWLAARCISIVTGSLNRLLTASRHVHATSSQDPDHASNLINVSWRLARRCVLVHLVISLAPSPRVFQFGFNDPTINLLWPSFDQIDPFRCPRSALNSKLRIHNYGVFEVCRDTRHKRLALLS